MSFPVPVKYKITATPDNIVVEYSNGQEWEGLPSPPDGGGNGYTLAEIASKSQPSGDIDLSGIKTEAYGLSRFSAITSIKGTLADGSSLENTFAYNNGLVSANIFSPSATPGQNSPFTGCTNLVTAVLITNNNYEGTNCFNGCTKLEKADLLVKRIRTNGFYNCSKCATLILRRTDAITELENIGAIATNTPFKSGGSGGTLFVPAALISAYQSDATWSTILGYENNNIVAIEGSIYEHAYADGTPI